MRRGVIELLAAALLVMIALAVAWKLGLFELMRSGALEQAAMDLRRVPFITPIFVVAAAVGIMLWCPVTLLAVLGGALFGLRDGLVLNWVGAMLGAIGGYELTSRIRKDIRAVFLERHKHRIDTLGGANGFMAIFRLRLIPIVPFALVNTAGAFAEVPRRDYLIASALGSIPSIVAYTFCGQGVLAGVEGAGHRALVRVAIAGGVLLVLSFAPSAFRARGSRADGAHS